MNKAQIASVKGQMTLCYNASRRLAEADCQFMEVMRSDNPLTKEDFEKLRRLRPSLWDRYAGFFK